MDNLTVLDLAKLSILDRLICLIDLRLEQI